MSASRRVPTLIAGLAFGLALLPGAQSASAAEVTNPADHPVPITVTIDGQQYTDGLDTLPGFDDHACTPIPNVEFDFASNRVLYYDSDSALLDTADWTEWARISSYATWEKQQKPSTTPTPTPTAPTPSKTDTAPSGSGGGGSSAAGGGGSAPTTTTATATTPTTPAAKAKAKAKAKAEKRKTAKEKKSGGSSSPKNSAKDAAVVAGVAASGDKSSPNSKSADDPSRKSDQAKGSEDPATEDAEESLDDEGVPVETPDATTPGVPAVAGAAVVAAGSAAKPQAKVVAEAGQGAGDTRLAGAGILGVLSLVGLTLLGQPLHARCRS